MDGLACEACFSPISLTFWGPVGFGVCRDELHPNAYEGLDNEGLHVAVEAGALRRG